MSLFMIDMITYAATVGIACYALIRTSMLKRDIKGLAGDNEHLVMRISSLASRITDIERATDEVATNVFAIRAKEKVELPKTKATKAKTRKAR